jgi:uncharacterized membrane protein YkvA (DUF1232 family)
MLLRVLLGAGAAILLSWLALLVALLVVRPARVPAQRGPAATARCAAAAAAPASDPTLPPGVKARLWLLLAYLAIPIDVVPDFIPILGYADDAIIVTGVLRSVVRRAGLQPLQRHRPGSPDGLTAVVRLCGLTGQDALSDTP